MGGIRASPGPGKCCLWAGTLRVLNTGQELSQLQEQWGQLWKLNSRGAMVHPKSSGGDLGAEGRLLRSPDPMLLCGNKS